MSFKLSLSFFSNSSTNKYYKKALFLIFEIFINFVYYGKVSRNSFQSYRRHYNKYSLSNCG